MGTPRPGRNVTRPPNGPVQSSPSEGEQALGGHEGAEDTFRQDEERYRRLVENFPDTISVLDEEKILYVNPAGAGLVGAEKPEDLIGKPYLDFVHTDFRKLAKSRVLQAQREGVTAELIEEKLLRLDGGVVYVEAMVMPITYGGKAAALSVIRDITGRKRAEEALK